MVKNKITKFVFIIIFISSFILPTSLIAQEIHEDLQGVWRAEVVEIVSEGIKPIPGTDLNTKFQNIKAKILEGERAGEIVDIENDFIILKEGQKFYMNYLLTISGDEIYSVRDIDRRAIIFWMTIIFAAVILFFGGWQGFRSILSLIGSFLVIIFILLPLLIKGFNPVLVSIAIGAVILGVAIFFTHGFNMRSLVAYLGTVISICITGILAFVSIKILNLTGFFSDETIYLNFGTRGLLDFEGLLLGGIIIGVLGVLDDVAVTQVAVVSEIKKAAEKISAKDLYKKALNVGHEHISALVNTIVLAYTGVSLPLLLWFSQSDSSFGKIINNEVFATEITRTIVGSIGLILTVPITTFLAVLLVDKYKNSNSHGHTHAHGIDLNEDIH